MNENNHEDYMRELTEKNEKRAALYTASQSLCMDIDDLQFWKEKVEEVRNKVEEFDKTMTQSFIDNYGWEIKITAHKQVCGEEKEFILYEYTMTNQDDIMEIIRDRLFAGIEHALHMFAENTKHINGIAEQWNSDNTK